MSIAVLVTAAIFGWAQTTPITNSQADAIELLRRTLAEQQSNPGRVVRTESAPTAPAVKLSPQAAARRSELERQYLDGKLSARNYQKAIDQLEAEEKKRLAAEAASPKSNAQPPAAAKIVAATNSSSSKATKPRATSPKNSESAIVTPPAGTVTSASTPVEPTPQQKKIADVEARIDEMLRLKAEREKALTNAATAATNAPSGPLTRRQRLDALLKQNLEGKLSDTDYQALRAKLLAEPE